MSHDMNKPQNDSGQDGLLRFRRGSGWLVFSGGQTPGSPIRAQALARARAYGAVAYISTADDGGDSMMDDLEDLGARVGYFIDLEFDSPEAIKENLEGASLIVLEAGTSLDAFYRAMRGAALEGLEEAYERGAVIFAEGLAINLFGRWVISDQGQVLEGIEWVERTFIEPQSSGAEDSRAVQAVLHQFPEAVAINIVEGSALVMGGEEGRVEIWGDAVDGVTLSLGRQYAVD